MRHETLVLGDDLRLECLRASHHTLVRELAADGDAHRVTGLPRPDPDDPQGWLASRRARTPAVFAIHQGVEAVGYAQLLVAVGVGAPTLWLRPAWRARGVGPQVIGALVRVAQSLGMRSLVTAIRDDNRRSQRAFQRSGWQLTAWRARAPYEDCAFWALALPPTLLDQPLPSFVPAFYRETAPLLNLNGETQRAGVTTRDHG
ncbi:MAG: hypothetical protein C0449_07490 [Polaromonas sp.]|nr:hypothetical protein [Polaromonas sp.]